MTNLEWIVKNQYYLSTWLCELAFFAKHGRKCEICECRDCKLKSTADVVKALMEWHEEKNDEQI